MPWRVRRGSPNCPSSRPYAVENAETGRHVSCHATRRAALRQIAALNANVDEDSTSSAGLSYHPAVPVESKHKTVRAEFKALGSKGEFEALFSVFDVLDRDGDIVRKGAFEPAFDSDPNPPVVWTHRWDIPPIGETLDAEEIEKGARGHGRLFVDDHEVARQVYTAMKAGALKQFSYAYELADGGYFLREPDEDADEKSPRFDGMIRELTEFSSIFEWGPTLVGANPATVLTDGPKSIETLLGVKAKDVRVWLGIDEPDPDAFEKMKSLAVDLAAASKRGSRNSTKDSERLQQIHDLAVENGAKCAETDDDPDDGKGHGHAGNGDLSTEQKALLDAEPVDVVRPDA
jgi:HK97 family phage prohead protease